MEEEKIKCEECGWKGTSKALLKAPSPFDKTDTLYGCPDCKDVNTFVVACDEEGCWSTVSCGTPTNNGYKRTCGKHRPESIYDTKHQSC